VILLNFPELSLSPKNRHFRQMPLKMLIPNTNPSSGRPNFPSYNPTKRASKTDIFVPVLRLIDIVRQDGAPEEMQDIVP
jgi:hypothetical protein